MNITENTAVWEAPLLNIQFLDTTESGMNTGSPVESTSASYVPGS